MPPIPPSLDTTASGCVAQRVADLGPWFHNIDVNGIATAPEHPLGDYPAVKWRRFAHAIPADLSGLSVLDVGCNAGFHAVEMVRRNAARVVAIDHDPHYLAQARFVFDRLALDIDLYRLDIYDIASLRERFDLVLCLGVLYHLRHPLLALDLIHAYAARDLLVVQTLQRGCSATGPVARDYGFWDASPFARPDWPRLHFIEHGYSGDPSNWWIPNRAATEAMLRASGFCVLSHPEAETFVCRKVDAPYGAAPVHPATPNPAA